MSKLNELWCVCVHEKGAVMIMNFGDMLDANQNLATKGEHSGYMVVHLCAQFRDAEDKKRAVKKGWADACDGACDHQVVARGRVKGDNAEAHFSADETKTDSKGEKDDGQTES